MKRYPFVLLVFLGVAALLALPQVSCQNGESTGGSRAYVIKNRASLIGGPMALGNLGDYMLENSQIRVVVSKHGISNAFGLFGGNIVDADRVRSGQGNSAGGTGFDTLVEMFPLFFLSAVDTNASKLIHDGKDGKPAIVRVEGQGASFIALTEQLNNLVTFMNGNNRLHFEMDYILEPGKNYLKLRITVRNKREGTYVFQTFQSDPKKPGPVPSAAGMVGLFGKRNTVFIPGVAGYDIRFSLEYIFTKRIEAPAIPGLVGDFIASHGMGGVSYGIVAEAHDNNYVYTYRDEFAKLNERGKPQVPLNKGSVMVPLEGSSITGCFSKLFPPKIKGGESFTYTVYVVIGDGSVSSIRDAQLEIHKRPKGLVGGQVVEAQSHTPLPKVRVLAYKGQGTQPGERVFYSDFVTDKNGNFRGYLEPGEYKLLARSGHLKS